MYNEGTTDYNECNTDVQRMYNEGTTDYNGLQRMCNGCTTDVQRI